MKNYLILYLSTIISKIQIGSVCCEKPKIAILGAGIGGSSCAYFINEKLGAGVHIDVYEAKQIGGRLATVEYEGSTYESGGAILHARNKYMNEFTHRFDLSKKEDKSDEETFGIYNGREFDFISSKFKSWTLVKMMWRYGFWSLRRLNSFIDSMLDQFDRIYELQEKGRSFATAEELMYEASSQFISYFNVSAKDGFSTHAQANDYIIDDLIRGSLRVNYGQSTYVPLFVGAVSVAGMFGSLWSVKDGNKRVPEKLLENSNANVLYRRVTKVVRDPSNGKYHVESTSDQEQLFLDTYDIVVVANPITSDSRMPIEFQNFTRPIEVAGSYHRTVATFVSGTINGSYFDLPENDAPSLIINNNVENVINSMGTLEPIGIEPTSTEKVWKVFTQRPLTEYELDELFQKRKVAKIVDWLAYPHYKRLQLSSKFVLDDRLFYVNAIEWAASAMEMSIIGAKNVALLVQKELANEHVLAQSETEKRRTMRSDL